MNKRLQTLGMGASLLAVLGVAAISGPAVFAQSPATPAATAAADKATPSAYSAFVARLATTLGITDPAKVDAAIKTSLKQMVDDRFTAGDISAKEATAMKAEIDAATDATGLLGLDNIVGNTGDAMSGDGQDSQSSDDQDTPDQHDQVGDGHGAQGDQQGNGSGADQDSVAAPSGNATGT